MHFRKVLSEFLQGESPGVAADSPLPPHADGLNDIAAPSTGTPGLSEHISLNVSFCIHLASWQKSREHSCWCSFISWRSHMFLSFRQSLLGALIGAEWGGKWGVLQSKEGPFLHCHVNLSLKVQKKMTAHHLIWTYNNPHCENIMSSLRERKMSFSWTSIWIYMHHTFPKLPTSLHPFFFLNQALNTHPDSDVGNLQPSKVTLCAITG